MTLQSSKTSSTMFSGFSIAWEEKWPSWFDGKEIPNLEIVTTNGEKKFLKIKIKIVTVHNNGNQFASSVQFGAFDAAKDSGLVITYNWPGRGFHSLYAEDYNPATRKFSCINTWGPDDNPNPKVCDDGTYGDVFSVNRV